MPPTPPPPPPRSRPSQRDRYRTARDAQASSSPATEAEAQGKGAAWLVVAAALLVLMVLMLLIVLLAWFAYQARNSSSSAEERRTSQQQSESTSGESGDQGADGDSDGGSNGDGGRNQGGSSEQGGGDTGRGDSGSEEGRSDSSDGGSGRGGPDKAGPKSGDGGRGSEGGGRSGGRPGDSGRPDGTHEEPSNPSKKGSNAARGFNAKPIGPTVVYLVECSERTAAKEYDVAVDAVEKSLASLASDQRFSLMAFSTECYEMYYPDALAGPTASSPANRKKSIEWLRRAYYRAAGSPDFAYALEIAFEMGATTVFVVARGDCPEGVPAEAMKFNNEKALVHAVGFETDDPLPNLRRLGEGSGGTFEVLR